MAKACKEDSWVERYYEALCFLYWEPQHLGRKRYEGAGFDTLAKVQEHIRRIEVTLNHIIKQFLSLSPGALRNRVFEFALQRPISGDFMLAGSDVDGDYHLQNTNQPDFLFTGNDETVSVEMKIEAKTSINQVLKYALLALAVELHENREMQHSLIFLAKDGFADLWKKNESYASVEDLQQALRGEALKEEKIKFFEKQPKNFRDHAPRFFEIVSSMSIGYLTYGALASLLDDEIAQSSGRVDAHIYRCLIAGMVGELKRRGLSSPQAQNQIDTTVIGARSSLS